MSVVKILLLIFGVIVVLVAIGMIVAGGGVLWANSALTDDDGYFTTKTLRIDKESYAIASESADIDVASIWGLGRLVTFKVEGSNDDPSKNIFIGVAEERDLEDYLRDVEYHEVTDLKISPDRLEYSKRPGNSKPASPHEQAFWTESAHGTGTQTLEWELESGTWSLVLMNDDGSAGIDLSIVLGAKIPHLFSVGIGFVVGGIVALLLGAFMIVLAVRRSPRS